MSGEFEWTITVNALNRYGDKIVSQTPATVIAKNRAEVTTKVRAAWGVTYDDFRKFWSHSWSLISVRELIDSEASK